MVARYIPANSRVLTHPDKLGIVYAYTTRAGKPAAIAYAGKAGKAAWHYSLSSLASLYERAAEFFSGLEQSRAMKAEFRAERTKPHTLAVGDIIHHSWGWEQTQCDFYQVLSVTPHGATIQAIGSATVPGSEGFMSERQMPIRDHFVRRCGSGPIEEPLKVRVSGDNVVTSLKHGSATKWDGQAKYCSWYG